MIVAITDVGDVGVIKDTPAHLLPLGAWTDANNVRFIKGGVQKCNGHGSHLTPAAAPYGIFSCQSLSTHYWVFLTLTEAYQFTATTATEITRGMPTPTNYTGTANDQWNGGMFGGIPFFNNGVDPPQVWNPIGSAALANLTNWPAGATCKVLRAFNNYMVALDVTKSGTRHPLMVKWSDTTAMGSLPASWDETDATKDAGETTLEGDGEKIVDCARLGDLNVIYLDKSRWTMQYVGPPSIFYFRNVSKTSGLLGQGCAQVFSDRMHFVVTQDDVVLFDGLEQNSIIDHRMRNSLFDDVSASSQPWRTFVLPRRDFREMWICFPSGGGTTVNKAYVWNWQLNNWSIRTIPNCTMMAYDIRGAAHSTYIAGISTDKIFKMNTTFQFDGTDYRSYVERTGLMLTKEPAHKVLRTIYPNITGDSGVEVKVFAGSHSTPDGTVTWNQNPVLFRVGLDREARIHSEGHFLTVRFEEASSKNWKLHDYALEFETTGVR